MCISIKVRKNAELFDILNTKPPNTCLCGNKLLFSYYYSKCTLKYLACNWELYVKGAHEELVQPIRSMHFTT